MSLSTDLTTISRKDIVREPVKEEDKSIGKSISEKVENVVYFLLNPNDECCTHLVSSHTFTQEWKDCLQYLGKNHELPRHVCSSLVSWTSTLLHPRLRLLALHFHIGSHPFHLLLDYKLYE